MRRSDSSHGMPLAEPTNKGFADLRLGPLYKDLTPSSDYFYERFCLFAGSQGTGCRRV